MQVQKNAASVWEVLALLSLGSEGYIVKINIVNV